LRRWFRFSSRSDEPDGQSGAATQVEEAASAESEGSGIPEAELSPVADSSVEQTPIEPTPEPAAAADVPGPEPESVADALEKLFPGMRDFGAGTHDLENAGVKTGHDWEPILENMTPLRRTEEPAISAAELPSAAHILAELFSTEQESTEGAADAIESADAPEAEDAEVLAGTAEPVVSVQEEADRSAGAPEQEVVADPGTPEHSEASSENMPPAAVTEVPRPPYRDWALEEKLAAHREWVESQGLSGKKADFAGADLEGTELISVNLRFADFHDANLKSADLLLADLRDACLVRADLQDACLVGANLEGANLEGASLETAMGLVPRQIAGANLRDASLPAPFLEFAAVANFERASRSASRFFMAMMSASAVCWLILWKTKDVQLVTDSAVIPFLHSRAAAAALPTVESYLILPVSLFILYLVFHFHLQSVWDAVLELPAVFPDGRALGDRGPGIVLGLLRTHFRWIEQDASSTRLVEKGFSVLLAYWTVPATLVLFWGRYLTRQEVRGTLLHALLAVIATGVAVYATAKAGRPQERWVIERKWTQRFVAKLRAINPAAVAMGLAAVLLFLSIGTIAGAPHGRSRAPQYGAASIRRWASTAFWSMGFDPYADLTEASISARPANWTGAETQLASVSGPRLNDANFRYAQAYGAFLANAHLWRSDFEGAFLSEADLRNADLGQSNFRYALMDGARMDHANLDRAVLDKADLRRADLRDANLSHAWLIQATLVDAQLERASFYGARLSLATMTRANLQGADLRECYLDGAQLERADLRGAYLWSAKFSEADLKGAQFGNAILIDAYLRGADLRWAQFPGTVLNGADLSGANLDGADLRGALGLSANQVCSAKSRAGVQLDDAIQTQVQAQCPAAQ
jgi:uncharacterized protein YjbI with pentapeptide repeats